MLKTRQKTPQNTTSRNKSEQVGTSQSGSVVQWLFSGCSVVVQWLFSGCCVPQWNSEVQSGSRTVGNSKTGCPDVDTLPAWQLHLDHATHQGG